MRAPAFWGRRPGVAAWALSPLAALYGTFSARRLNWQGVRASVPVLCVGNLVAGGAGKTPTCLALAGFLRDQGFSPVFLSRGYSGRLDGPVLVDPARHTSPDVGDESLLLARVAPTIVARDRPAGANLAARHGDCIIMDDGLQNPSLEKDFTLAVIDSGQVFGNGFCIPAGPLRAPLAAQWPRIDACLIIGTEASEVALDERSIPVSRFSGRLLPRGETASTLSGRGVLAFAGIGRPEKFSGTLRSLGALVKATRTFDDHHAYRVDEIEALLHEAETKNLVPVTTAKDAVRIASTAPQSLLKITILDIDLEIDGRDQLLALICGAFAR